MSSSKSVAISGTAKATKQFREAPNRRLLKEDGLSPLRRMLVESPEPFKCAIHRGSVQVCKEFQQGFAGRGCERCAPQRLRRSR